MQSIIDKLNRHGDLILKSSMSRIDKSNQKIESGRSPLSSGDTSNQLAVSMQDSIAYEDLEKHKPEHLEILEIRDTENYFETLSNRSSSARQESTVGGVDSKEKMDIVEPSLAESLNAHEWKLGTNKVSIRIHLIEIS